MQINVLGYALLVFLTFIFSCVFECDGSKYLLFVLILMLLLDGASVYYFCKKIKAYIFIEKNEIEKNQDFECTIRYNNTGFFPAVNINAYLKLNRNISSKDIYIEKVSLSSKSIKNSNVIFRGLHIGKGNVELQYVKINGLFGIFQKNIDINQKIKMYILPRILPASSNNMEFAYKTENITEDKQQLGYDYKKYIKGSAVGGINWKHYAKTNELYVRKGESEVYKCNYSVVLDTYNGCKFTDDLIETLISLVSYLLDNRIKIRLFIDFISEYSPIIIDSKSDLYSIKKQFSKARLNTTNPNFYKQIIRDNNSSYIIITSNDDFDDSNYSMNNISLINIQSKEKFEDAYVNRNSKINNKINYYYSVVCADKCIIERI